MASNFLAVYRELFSEKQLAISEQFIEDLEAGEILEQLTGSQCHYYTVSDSEIKLFLFGGAVTKLNVATQRWQRADCTVDNTTGPGPPMCE